MSTKCSKCNSFQVTSDLLKCENLIVATAQPCNGLTGLQFYNVIAAPKLGEQHTNKNTINAIVLKLQVIYSTVRIKRILLSSAKNYRCATLLCHRGSNKR